jgi:hypothetical protein
MMLQDLPLDISLFPTREGVYIVGGTTRDLLLGKQPVDYDIAVSQNPEIFAKKTAAAYGGRVVPMGRADKKSYRVVAGDTIIDITGIDGATIQNDMERRDFTINAMAIELTSGACLDHVGGRHNLAEKQIRMVWEQGFRDDPIRLLRAFRLAATLGFSIGTQTLSTIARDAHLIRLSAGERIRSELYQLLSSPDSSPHIKIMAQTGLLRGILPELSGASADENSPPQEADVRPRLLTTYRHLETAINHPPPGFTIRGADGQSPILASHGAWLKFAILLTRQNRMPADTAAPPGNDTANGTEALCRRLRLSAKETSFVTGIVCNHPIPLHLYDAFVAGRLTPKTVIRFFMAVDALAPPLLLCALAESRSTHGDRTSFRNFVQHMLRTYNETYLPGKAHSPFVSGRDLMDVFGLTPSPVFSRILARLKEGQISGELPDRASALQMAEKLTGEFKPQGNRI